MIEILEPATDVVVQVNENPALAILNEEKFEAFYEKIKKEAAKVSGDVSTNKARDEVRSMAFKIAKTRTAIDKARLGLTEEWRTKTNQANAAGKAIKERLEALEDQVRKPLTDWEQAGNVAELRAVFGEVYKHFPAYDDATRDALTDLKDAVKLDLTEAV